MRRRDFLKFGGLLSAAFFVEFSPLEKLTSSLIPAESHDKLYRGTFDGKISVSENAGRTWQLHTHLGREYSILGMSVDPSKQVCAQIEFAGHRFELLLAPNGKNWLVR